MRQHVIALVDCDCFFVSCERKDNPDLQGKPVCVMTGASSKGIISLDMLLDMRLNNSITQEQYNKKYNDITKQIETTDTKLTRYNEITKQGLNTLEDLILLVSKIPEIYKNSNYDEKRKVLKLLYSNLFLQGKNPLFSIRKPLENILSRGLCHVWSGRRDWLDFC